MKFNYKPLTKHQLAKMVYELNKELVEILEIVGGKNIGSRDVSEKAQKMIARARTEGIL